MNIIMNKQKQDQERAAQNRAKFAIKSFTISETLKNGKCRRMRSIIGDARQDTIRNEEIRKKAGQADWLLESLDLLDSMELVMTKTNGLMDGANQRQVPSPISEEAANNGLKNNNNNKTNGCSIDDVEQQRAKVVAEVISSTLRDDFPRHISHLDDCHHLLIKYEPELDPTHPGFHDLEYRARRKEVAEIAFNYKYGEPIPEVKYDHRELQTWAYIYDRLKVAYEKYACERHNRALAELERECGYSAHSIPQLQQVSEYLQARTGWTLRPAAGLLSARDFLASLAFRVFQTTQYIRHWGNPEHSVEPDCIHELMGHIPMLCDPEFAQFSQEIGLASLGASDLEIERFATIYWFTVEFGLCRESGELKCYGAGLLSSYGEMEHALESGLPQLREFVAEETALVEYDDAEYQVVYYVAQTFEDATERIKQYAAKHLDREYELVFDPYTSSIRELNSLDELANVANGIHRDMRRLHSAISKMHSKQQQQQDESSTSISSSIKVNTTNNKIDQAVKITNNKKQNSLSAPSAHRQSLTMTIGQLQAVRNGAVNQNGSSTVNGELHGEIEAN